MRVLLADLPGADSLILGAPVDDASLAALYTAQPRPGPWVRANFATSLDGAITGPDGKSGSINSAADHVVFELLRALSDVVVVGAGTLRSEGYTALTVQDRWWTTRSDLGIASADEFDIWIAVLAGLVNQHHANDPAGARYAGLLDRAVDMWADSVGLPSETAIKQARKARR